MKNKTALLILDGWGYGDKSSSDAIYNASTPVFDKLIERYPNARLLTHGLNVGLPEGQMGNSEVGHINIGAGRIVYQELTRIDKEIKEGSFKNNKALLNAFDAVKKNGCKLHIMGLVSDGGVHSSQDHLFELLRLCKSNGVQEKTYVHGFTDGRDCNPKTGLAHFEKLDKVLLSTGTTLGSIIGRFYAMDRDKRWVRVKKAYDLMVNGIGEEFTSYKDVFEANYAKNITDEFIAPALLNSNAKIEAGDVVICFNFRTDRCREICEVLTQQDFPEFEMNTLAIDLFTMTSYDNRFKNVNIIYSKEILTKTLGEIVESAGLSQLRIAETEKYPHVSYFFSGGREKPFIKESRIMVPSPSVKTYDLQPEMSAHAIGKEVINAVEQDAPDFICLNFANTDMVGHTGVYSAIIKAAETVDEVLGEVVENLKRNGYNIIIIADHGNADFALNADGTPNTAHSKNPVPVILISNEKHEIHDGVLADVGPTILNLMQINVPVEMTGNTLLKKKP